MAAGSSVAKQITKRGKRRRTIDSYRCGSQRLFNVYVGHYRQNNVDRQKLQKLRSYWQYYHFKVNERILDLSYLRREHSHSFYPKQIWLRWLGHTRYKKLRKNCKKWNPHRHSSRWIFIDFDPSRRRHLWRRLSETISQLWWYIDDPPNWNCRQRLLWFKSL